MNIEKRLASIERQRFISLEEMKKHIEDKFKGFKCELDFKSIVVDDDFFPNDFEIIGDLINNKKDILINIDFWYLRDRYNMLYITESKFEVE